MTEIAESKILDHGKVSSLLRSLGKLVFAPEFDHLRPVLKFQTKHQQFQTIKALHRNQLKAIFGNIYQGVGAD